jgi:DNA-binding IclR family transcriptional regulator
VVEQVERQRNPVARAFRLLVWMAEQEGETWGVREIAAGVGMHPSTVHRLLATLEPDGLVRRDPGSGRYGLGLEFLRAAWRTASRNSLAQLGVPVLRRLRDETGETAVLGVYDHARRAMLLVASVESEHAVRNVRPLHTWMPVHGGASGRALLAWLPDEERAAVLGGPLAAVTDATITTRGALERNLEEVRRQGYALSRGERVPGGVGVAAPVLDAGGRVVAAVGITMPEQRFAPADEPRLAALVVAAAAELGERLGA